MTSDIIQVDPQKLKNHPLNIEIYSDVCDPEFMESCRGGIHTPLLVTMDYTIISGHRRMQATRILELKTVPCIVLKNLTKLEIKEILILSNRQREKTTEMKAREFQHLKVIEQERAKDRQKQSQGQGKKGPVNLPDLNGAGDTRDIAAEKVGMSGRNAEKASQVVGVIDELKEEGRNEEAEELRQDLNKSVRKAYQKTTASESEEEIDPDDVKELRKPYGALIRYLGAAKKELEKLQKTPTGAYVNSTQIQQFNAAIIDAIGVVKWCQPYALCTYCKEKKGGCKMCRRTRFLNKRLAENAPRETDDLTIRS
jgi:ParB-like chromosome segregation protein Spo0J